MASGTNKHVHSSGLKEINHCCWDERKMSGVIVKLKKIAGILRVSVKPDWWGLFLWMVMSQVTHKQLFPKLSKKGEEHNTRYTNPMYMGIISPRAIENSGYYGLKSLILNLFVDCNRWWYFCIPSVKVWNSDIAFQITIQSNPLQRLAKPLCTDVSHALSLCAEQDFSAHTESTLEMPLWPWFPSLTPLSHVLLLRAPILFLFMIF